MAQYHWGVINDCSIFKQDQTRIQQKACRNRAIVSFSITWCWCIGPRRNQFHGLKRFFRGQLIHQHEPQLVAFTGLLVYTVPASRPSIPKQKRTHHKTNPHKHKQNYKKTRKNDTQGEKITSTNGPIMTVPTPHIFPKTTTRGVTCTDGISDFSIPSAISGQH